MGKEKGGELPRPGASACARGSSPPAIAVITAIISVQRVTKLRIRKPRAQIPRRPLFDVPHEFDLLLAVNHRRSPYNVGTLPIRLDGFNRLGGNPFRYPTAFAVKRIGGCHPIPALLKDSANRKMLFQCMRRHIGIVRDACHAYRLHRI